MSTSKVGKPSSAKHPHADNEQDRAAVYRAIHQRRDMRHSSLGDAVEQLLDLTPLYTVLEPLDLLTA